MKHIDAGNADQQISPHRIQWAAPAPQLVGEFNRAASTDEVGEMQAGHRDDGDLDKCSSLEDILQILIDRNA